MIAVDSQLTDTIREHADVVFPAEAYPEKEGTLVHPDGRVQRLRPAIGRARGRGGQPGSGVRPLWQVIAEVARALGYESGDARSGAQVSRRLFDAVPFYAGLTLEEIGGRGVRWPERDGLRVPRLGAGRASSLPPACPRPATAACGSAPTARCGRPRRSTSRRRCSSSAPARSRSSRRRTPPRSASDEGDRVEVGNGTRVQAHVRKLRAAVPAGSVFLAEGTREDSWNVLTGGLVEVHRVGPARRIRPRCPPRSSPPSRAWPRCRRPRPPADPAAGVT